MSSGRRFSEKRETNPKLNSAQLEKAKKALELLSSINNDNDADVDEGTSQTSAAHVLAAANKCLSSFTLMPKKRTAKQELSSLFRKKQKSASVEPVSSSKCLWKHRFVCLAFCDQDKIPTCDADKDELLRAGLGEKEIKFYDLDIEAEEFRDLLYKEFPSLKKGGGFQFLKCLPNSRNLQLLSSSTLSSPSALKSRIGAGRTYIRPLQQDLPLSVLFDLPSGPKEKCLTCGNEFSFGELASHISSCAKAMLSPGTPESVPSPKCIEKVPSIDLTLDDQQDKKEYSDSDLEDDVPQLPPVTFLNSNVEEIEKEMVTAAVEESLIADTNPLFDFKPCSPVSPMKSEIDKMKRNLDNENVCVLEVRRDFVLVDTMKQVHRKKFDPKKFLKISFVGECSVDAGGPKREFFHLFFTDALRCFFSGSTDKPQFFQNNILALQNRDFYYLGLFCVLSILYGGHGFPVMATSVFEYLVHNSIDATSTSVDDIPDPLLTHLIKKLNEAETDDDVQVSCSVDEAMDLLLVSGFRRPVSCLTLNDCQSLKQALLNYHLIAKVKAELDQFKEGLHLFKFYDLLISDPEMWKPFFLYSSNDLTPDKIKALFSVIFSEKGSVSRQVQERAYMFFVNFLDECYEEDIGCNLSDVLIFSTGADRIPPLGFEKRMYLVFLSGSARVPTATTCDPILRLPTLHTKYEDFRDDMLWGLKGNDGFGAGP